jgi:hypothetical protein
VRKYLGVLAIVAALCVISWAQTPTPAPPPDQPPAQTPPPSPVPEAKTIPTIPEKAAKPPLAYPRFEIFAGGSYAETGFFNTGNWAGLYGWDSSLGVNATSWLGLIVEGGQYFGTSRIPTNSPDPFPKCPNAFCPSGSPTFNVDTREYNILFGAQFARRRYAHWTPLGEVLYGHQGTRGEASGGGTTNVQVGTGPAIVAGGGLDYKINPRFALRFKADYFETASQFPGFPKKRQDNFRFSVGLVIRSVPRKKRKLEDETQLEP